MIAARGGVSKIVFPEAVQGNRYIYAGWSCRKKEYDRRERKAIEDIGNILPTFLPWCLLILYLELKHSDTSQTDACSLR